MSHTENLQNIMALRVENYLGEKLGGHSLYLLKLIKFWANYVSETKLSLTTSPRIGVLGKGHLYGKFETSFV